MKPFNRSARWFRSRLLPRIRKGFRKGEPLTLAGVWILCTSCSFNNSFQDGCLGNIRITVPDTNQGAAGPKRARNGKQQKATGSKDDGKSGPVAPKEMRNHTVVVTQKQGIPSLAQQASTAALRLMRMKWARWSKSTPRERGKAPVKVPKQHVRTLPEPPRRYQGTNTWHASQARHMPGVVKMFFWQAPDMPPPPSRAPILRNGEGLETWKERPNRVKLCFHTQDPNPGWTRFHMPRNTYQIDTHCRAGYPLGSGKHWFLVDDTYAASATPCRVFFSPGRAHIVAQCGVTIYRSSIKRAASCLQTGKTCRTPYAVLRKMPTYHTQPVEWRPQ